MWGVSATRPQKRFSRKGTGKEPRTHVLGGAFRAEPRVGGTILAVGGQYVSFFFFVLSVVAPSEDGGSCKLAIFLLAVTVSRFSAVATYR